MLCDSKLQCQIASYYQSVRGWSRKLRTQASCPRLTALDSVPSFITYKNVWQNPIHSIHIVIQLLMEILASEWVRIPATETYFPLKRKGLNRAKELSSEKSRQRFAYRVAAIALWFRLCLPSCGPGFKSQANHLPFLQFILL